MFRWEIEGICSEAHQRPLPAYKLDCFYRRNLLKSHLLLLETSVKGLQSCMRELR